MVRIAHLSDTHLGTRIREGVKQQVWAKEMQILLLENDFYERFIEIFERIKALNPPIDVVIHSGDLYDSPTPQNPSQPPVKAQEIATEVLKSFTEVTGIPVIIIEGNHGLYRQLDVSLLDVLRVSVPGLKIATQVDLKKAIANDEPLKFEFEDFEVFCYPYISPEILEAGDLIQRFNEWATIRQAPSNDIVSIAVAHGMPLDHTLYPVIENINYDYIALGHDHRQQKYRQNAWYAGAPERWRFDEANMKKGFLVVDVEKGKTPHIDQEFIEFQRPVYNEKMRIESDDSIESLIDRIEKWLDEEGMKNEWNPQTAARVRITFDGASTRIMGFDLNMALETLRSKLLAKDSEYNIVQFTWPPRSASIDFSPSAYEEITSEYLIDDPEGDFREFLESWNIGGDYEPEILIKIAARALEIAARAKGEKMTVEDLEDKI